MERKLAAFDTNYPKEFLKLLGGLAKPTEKDAELAKR